MVISLVPFKATKKKNKPEPIKPFLKWVGGKTQLVDEIKACLPQKYNRYFEPFLGGGAVFFRIIPNDKEAILADINKNLIGAYLDIRDSFKFVVKQFNSLVNEFIKIDSEEKRKVFFNERRAEYNNLRTAGTSVKRTGLLLFINKTCFNGVYRENNKGEFNVPYGRPVLSNLINSVKYIENVSNKLKNKLILNSNYIEVLKIAKKGDFVYLDPPYVPLTKTSAFTQYHSSGFTGTDHYKLADIFKQLDKKGCYVLMSNSDTEKVRELYKDYEKYIVLVKANRVINCKGHLRGDMNELLIKNY